MLEIQKIRENQQEIVERLSKRNADWAEKIKEILSLDEEKRKCQKQLDDILAEANQVSAQIAVYFKEGNKAAAEEAKSQGAALKIKSTELKTVLDEAEQKLYDELIKLPNTPYHLVKAGKTPDDNEIIEECGKINEQNEGLLPHWELGSLYDLFDLEAGVKLTGAGFPVYKNNGARLQRALISFFLDEARNAGFYEVIPPYFVNEDTAYGTGQLPDKEGQMYVIQEERPFYLIPTAEVPVTNLYRDEILNENQLPVKLTAHSPCFRREAGSYGKDVRGLNRVHQFDKVEIVVIEKPEKSYEMLENMCTYVGRLLAKLNLPYRKLRLCGGDMGFASAMTYDFEVYSPAQQKWLEVSSVSNFETFQSHRMKIRIRNQDGKTQLAHTLNGSALALPRIVAALLENNQSKLGIHIPDCLVPYFGADLIKK